MKETENGGLTAYEAGRVFYSQKIEEAREVITTAENAFDLLSAIEDKELAELKLMQLNRREELLNKNELPRQTT